MIRRPPRSTLSSSSAASDVYKRQYQRRVRGRSRGNMAEQKQMQTMDSLNKELAEVQAETMKTISGMINVNVDTLETIARQIEQTEGDIRLLTQAQSDLNEAQQLINSIKRGIFSFGSSRPKTFNMPEKLPNDIDFECKVDGRKRIIRVSTLMYQAEEGCKTGSVSIPYNYVEGVWVRKDMKTMVIHFRGAYHKQIGKDSWTIELLQPLRLQEFIKALKTRVIQKGCADEEVRAKVRTRVEDEISRGDAMFVLAFEDKAKAFKVEEDAVAVNQGMVQDLMRDYHEAFAASKAAGGQGEVDHDKITQLTIRGLEIVGDQLDDVAEHLQHHMHLLVEEEKLMIVLTAQADDLTKQNEELLNQSECCCVVM
eukprot:TRINITY_DN16547_c0_g1_i1.p1 TRINITY_DN16547_c0_g1~~TRINITY_DN16547_c0_g1_i1.p1  ORF type:complete len:368 (+),score=135.45 TRINITY_DN16547_c0_g1_i1:79-1182(+)